MEALKKWTGYHHKLDYRIRTAYIINSICMTQALLFIYIYGFYAKYLMAMPGIITYFLSTVAVFIMLRLRKYKLAKALILIGFLLQESSIVFYLFPSGVHFNLYLFIVAPITFFIFDFDDPTEKKMTYVFSIIAVILFTLSELMASRAYIIQVAPDVLRLFNSISSFSAIMAISIVFMFFSLELSKSQNELKHLANTDALTSIYNRRKFFEMGEYQFDLALKYERRLTVILLDVDHFKHVNDSYGHPAGDVVLVQVAQLIRGIIRKGDVLSRYGGEEFALLIKEAECEESILVAEKIRQTIADHHFKIDEDESVNITVSLGVACFWGDFEKFDQMVKKADNNLYQAKEAGRNKVVSDR